ncbi:plasma membrane localization protein [Apophysomyces sp. BC1034]|nr:plasma membrane localization protein [Apophysomyces sp. BC1034]
MKAFLAATWFCCLLLFSDPGHALDPQPSFAAPAKPSQQQDPAPENLIRTYAKIPLRNGMSFAVLGTQYADHYSYEVYFDPAGQAYWKEDLCLAWLIGVPPIDDENDLKCDFAKADACMDAMPQNPCQQGLEAHGCLGNLKTNLSRSGYSQRVRLDVSNITFSETFPNYQTEPVLQDVSVLISYTWQIYLSDVHRSFECTNLHRGHGTLDHFTVTSNSARGLSLGDEGEKGPRSSELSYLTFYASSRPVKLTKVGTFLEKKVERDIQKGRKQNSHVSLEILKSLIQACHRDLNLFSKYVVRILSMTLGSKDIDLIDLTCETFVVFCGYHDGSTLGVDAEFTSDYEALIKKFAGFCDHTEADDTMTWQMRYIGHRAMYATVTSSALHASNFKIQLGAILPPLITTLEASKKPSNVLAQSEVSVDTRVSDGHSLDKDREFVDILAAKTISTLFNKANGAAIRMVLNPIFGFMDAKEKWWPPNFAVSIMELVLESLQPQYRYLLVSEVLQQLENASTGNNSCITNKHGSLVSVLDTILNANIPLVGISVLEVLNSLFTNLIKSLQGSHFREKEPDQNDEASTYEFAIHQGLAHSIGGLASQTYYQNQLNDITGYIIAKLRAGTTLEQVDGLPITEYRRVALKCLDFVASAGKEVTEADNEDQCDISVASSLDTWIPAVGLLTDKRSETRVDFAMTLVRYLDSTAEQDLGLDPFPKHTLNQHGDVSFVNALHATIVDWAQLPDCTVDDVNALFSLLCSLTRRFGPDGTIKAVPLIFKLQSFVKDNVIQKPASQRAIAAVTVEWVWMVGKFYNIERLRQYASRIREERLSNREYSIIFQPEIMETVSEVHSLEDLEPENKTLVEKLLDRHVVVELMSKDGPFRDEEDTHGLDLESKLYAEWGSEAFMNHERSFRIRTSRNLDDLKPKLATPWTSTDFNRAQKSKKQTIKVENLKEALAAQSPEATEFEADTLQVMTTSSLAKRAKETRSDMSSLLSSLSLGPNHSQSTIFILGPLTLASEESLPIRNTSSVVVAFKVKTTAPRQYSVRPIRGIIEPNASLAIKVTREPLAEEPPADFRCKDKFLIESVRPTADLALKAPEKIWTYVDSNMRDSVQQSKIRCKILASGEASATAVDAEVSVKTQEEDACEKEEELVPPYTERPFLETEVEDIRVELRVMQQKIDQHTLELDIIRQEKSGLRPMVQPQVVTNGYPLHVLIAIAAVTAFLMYLFTKL